MTSVALTSLGDTRKLAERIGQALQPGDTVLLGGDLGAGKTTFAQYLIGSLSEEKVEVTSPTFNLVQDYPVILPDGTRTQVFHYDLYRIEQVSALAELGLDEAADKIRLIEWPSRLPGSFAPPSWISLHFALREGGRRVGMQSGGSAAQRLAA